MRRQACFYFAALSLVALALMGHAKAIAGGDTQPPNVISFDFNSKTVNTALSSQSITFTARFTDDISGVWGGFSGQSGTSTQAAFSSPSGQQTAWVLFFSSSNLVSGTPLDGIYSSTMIIPRYSETGVWRLAHLRLADEVQNFKILSQTDVVALGFPSEFVVTDTVYDIFLPSVLRLSQ